MGKLKQKLSYGKNWLSKIEMVGSGSAKEKKTFKVDAGKSEIIYIEGPANITVTKR